jgi:hypothetical protein
MKTDVWAPEQYRLGKLVRNTSFTTPLSAAFRVIVTLVFFLFSRFGALILSNTPSEFAQFAGFRLAKAIRSRAASL